MVIDFGPGETPELFLDEFPEAGVPRVRFERGRVPKEVWVTETTHRDGQQGGIPFTTEQAVRAYELIDRVSGPGRAIRQAEFFVYAKSDRDAFLRCLELWRSGKARVEPTTWIRASAPDVKLLRELGVRETGLLASASDYHTFFKFKPGGRARAAQTYLDAVRLALDSGIRPRVHLEDATRAPFEGFMLPFVRAVEELARPYGEALRPRFRLCDTLGIGLPFEDAPLPRSIPRLVRAVIEQAGVEGERLEIHPHNDTGLVVANALAAVRAGCAAVNGCLLGKGERTGNAPLEVVLFHLMGLSNVAPDLAAVNELVHFYETLGEPVAPKHPLFGRDAHLTRAGIHADALKKDRRTYTFCDTEAVLGRPLEVLLTKESGLGGLAFLVLQRTGRSLEKDDPRLRATWSALEGEFAGGRTVAYGWEELSSRFPELAA
jgi:2-phosphinomethylmalic acid synthase